MNHATIFPDDFITTFLAMLSERGILGDLLEHSMNLNTPASTARKKVINAATNGSSVGTNGTNSGHGKSKSKLKKNQQKPCRGRPKKKK